MNFACPNCQRNLAFGDHMAGKMGRCPQCHGVIRIPALSPSPPPELQTTTNLSCPTCQRNLVAQEEMAGKPVLCPHCQSVVRVPPPSPLPPPHEITASAYHLRAEKFRLD